MNKLDDIFVTEIRPVTPDDLGYVINTFERALRPLYMQAANSDFSHAIKTKINDLLLGDGQILVATPPGNSKILWGWVLYDPTAVHFVYVRNTHRGVGIARKLITAANHNTDPICCTAITNTALLIFHKHPLRYLPIL